MSPETRRRALLLGAVSLLGAAVVADRAGLFAGGGETEESGSATEAYLRTAALVEESESAAAGLEDLRSVIRTGEAQWQAARARLIEAPSADVAADRLRRAAETAMSDLGLKLAVSAVSPPRAPVEGEALRVIALTLDFEAPNPDVVWRLIDRLENLPEARTSIARLTVTGPGPGVRTGLRVSLDLQALALVSVDGAATGGRR